jgi:hypothetical protein
MTELTERSHKTIHALLLQKNFIDDVIAENENLKLEQAKLHQYNHIPELRAQQT